MPTKTYSKGTKKSAKKSTKTSSKRGGPIRTLYGPPIYKAIERGDTKEMKALASEARRQIASIRSALAALEKKIGSV